MNTYDPEYLDIEEKEIMESINSMDLSKIEPPTEEEEKRIKAAAKEFIKKNTKMNNLTNY